MKRTVTFLEKDYSNLQQHLFKDGNEQAAYLLCSLSQTDKEIRLLVKEVIFVENKHIQINSQDGIYYTYESYMPVISKAKKEDDCFIMVHCHPNGLAEYSEIDDTEEIKLLKYVYNRIGNKYHGSLVFTDTDTFVGRLLNHHEELYEPINKIRVLGATYKFIYSAQEVAVTIDSEGILNRNVLAFGEILQQMLQNIHIGVVGCGGTGSAVVEELGRLGVGKLTIIDDDIFEDTNITRIHGSSISDVGTPKVIMMKNMIENLGIGTQVIAINERLDNKNTAIKLRDCDLIFSCLDYTHFARAILNQICLSYYIPLIDTGIKFDSREGKLNDIFGRVDVVTPNVSCLFCRGVINSNMIAAEKMSNEEYLRLKNEGYAPEISNDKIQAIPYNTLIASYAVIEMIQLLTNFKGKNDYHTVYRFNKSKSTNEGITADIKTGDCICDSEVYFGTGDTEPFLMLSWGESI